VSKHTTAECINIYGLVSKKGAASETARIKAFIKLPLTQRFVAGIRGMDLATATIA
jgi:hypothetical protein